jgi:hypothetical protein
MLKSSDRKTFVIPSTSGNYAPERITFGQRGAAQGVAGDAGCFLGITAIAESAPAGASLELWLPKANANLNGLADDQFFFCKTLVSGAAGETQALASVPAVQLRAKSGGTSGNMPTSAFVD